VGRGGAGHGSDPPRRAAGVDVKRVVRRADMHDAVMTGAREPTSGDGGGRGRLPARLPWPIRRATSARHLTLQLAKTTDILAALAALGECSLVRIGFAPRARIWSRTRPTARTEAADLIVANDSAARTRVRHRRQRVVLLDPTGGQRELPLLPKRELQTASWTSAAESRPSRGCHDKTYECGHGTANQVGAFNRKPRPGAFLSDMLR